MDEQDVATEDLIAGMPEWVGMLAIRQCVKAGDHDRDYPGACRKHLLEARRLAAWLAGEMDEPTALVLKHPRNLP